MNVAPTAEAAFAAAAPAPPPSTGDESALSAERPFPGLRPFGFADRAFFFGREKQTFALYRLVENGRFIAVVGSSGSGKSSLVLAGLKGLLADESADPGGPTWICLDMRPGASPLSRLAKTLARLAEKDNPYEAARCRVAIEYRLRQSSFSFESALEEAGGLGGRTLLLIVDQFEELFRFGLAGLGLRRAAIEQTRARDEATQFVQILLDADRRRLKDVRVLITMRSDFIGDCSYFHGLSEAVSATQYLAPNLTRSQLEDVIRKPIEKAAATIEPELVERLLNDCGDELDQLPVLQHCLMRLWDRAGAANPGGPRSLTCQTYDDVGRMKESLSRHADEILRQCAGKELVVEQTFRALSELDREGRAIRRALRFDKLLAETGVAESDLRGVLDKFRAPTCSFLAPPPSVTPTFAPGDRIDIGHETLLRRWKKLAGENETVEAKTGRPPEGWLAKEQMDGQRYRTLASLLEGGASGEMATLNDPERVKHWWDALPRTPAWADRYGGKFENVKKLIVDNIAAKQRGRHRQWIGRAAAIVLVLLAGGAFAHTYIVMEQARQEQIRREAEARGREEEARKRVEASAANRLLHDFLDAYHKGEITEGGAISLMGLVDNFAIKVQGSLSPPEAGQLWVETLNVKAELLMSSANPDDATRLTEHAKVDAQNLVRLYPKDPEALQLQFDSLIRRGDALIGQPNATSNIDAAFDEYSRALETATKLKSFDAGKRTMDDMAKAHLLLGDAYSKKSPPALEDALSAYRASLAVSEAAIKDYADDGDLALDQAAANFRIGLTSSELGLWDQASAALNEAKRIQDGIVDKTLAVKWDLGGTHIEVGDILATNVGPRNALDEYKKGVELREDRVANDPGSIRYRRLLAADYDKLMGVLDTLNLTDDDARNARRSQHENLKELVKRDSANIKWQAKVGLSAKRRGDLAKFPEFQLKHYREALEAWTALARRPTGAQLLRDFYSEHMDIGAAFAKAMEWPNAVAAYDAAANIARLHLAEDASNGDWRAKAERAEMDANAARASHTRPAPTPQ